MTDAALVVGLGGSPSESSVTGRLLDDCLLRCAALGARTETIDGRTLAALPIYVARRPPQDESPAQSGAVAAGLADAVRRADAVVIATPGYHGAMSGLVKNALDHLEALRFDARPYLHGRAVGIVVGASGWQACGTTLVGVRSAVHALRGWPTPLGVTVNTARQRPQDRVVTDALDILAGQLVDFAGWQAAGRAAAAVSGEAR